MEVAEYFSGIDLNFENTLVPTAGYLSGIPIARMSPATGAGFFLSGFVVFLLTLRNNLPKHNTLIQYLSGVLGILILLISFVFCLAYLYGTPLLYAYRATIPMALTTALGFMLLSVSILASEKDAFPLRLLSGASTLSYLLRFILPLSTLSVMLGGLAIITSGQALKMNPAFVSAALTVLIAVVAGFVATLISRHMGGEIDRSKEAVKQANQALLKSEDRYRSLVEDQTDLVCRFAPDGTFLYVNQSYCQFFNKTQKELIGNKWQPLPVEDDIGYIEEKLSTLSPTNPMVLIENRVRSGKGEIHWIQFANRGFFNHHGSLQEIQSVGRDITERKQAKARNKPAKLNIVFSPKISKMSFGFLMLNRCIFYMSALLLKGCVATHRMK